MLTIFHAGRALKEKDSLIAMSPLVMCLAGLLRGTPFYAGFLPQETATLHLLVPHPEGTDQVKKANSSLSAPTYHFVSFLP